MSPFELFCANVAKLNGSLVLLEFFARSPKFRPPNAGAVVDDFLSPPPLLAGCSVIGVDVSVGAAERERKRKKERKRTSIKKNQKSKTPFTK